NIASLSAEAKKMIISGGAKGVDSAAMYGTLEANGWACGVLADGLEKAVLDSRNRLALQNSKLVLISAFDPKSVFNVANAMQRNKYIYALADAALVVNSDLNKGGTWSGAVEQLDKYRQIPIYIRSTGSQSDGLNALKNKGALPWVNPNEIQGFLDVFYPTDFPHTSKKCESPVQMSLLDMTSLQNESGIIDKASFVKDHSIQIQESDSFVGSKPNDLLFIYVSKLIRNLTLSFSKKDSELAAELGISISQMRIWLKRLVDEKSMIKENRPIKYRWKKS
ncbi:MAG: DNA-processing protein DprA, partial [Haemophilus parainfluenzae]|nr:DNA-processing protein DprA [Haemophilus parainfluenzae]